MEDRTAQIGLVTHPGSFVGKAICWITNSPVYHVIVGVGPDTAISAEPHGAIIRPADFWPDTIWSRFIFNPRELEQIVAWCMGEVGTPYNWIDDAAIGIAMLFKQHTPEWVSRYLSSDYTLECAQLADSAYRHAGVHLFTDGRLPGTVYPGSFVPIWQDYGWWPTSDPIAKDY